MRNQLLRKNKRGSIVDIVFFIIALLGLFIFILVVGKVFGAIVPQLQDTPLGNLSSSNQALETTTDLTSTRLDYVFMILFVGLTIGILITSYNIESIPGLVPIYILMLALLVTIAAVGQYVAAEFYAVPEIASDSLWASMSSVIMGKLILISIGVGVLSMILIFAKPKSYSGGGF